MWLELPCLRRWQWLGGEPRQAANAAEQRMKVWPVPCASQAPCASEGCGAHSAPENNLSHRALHRESLAGFSLIQPCQKGGHHSRAKRREARQRERSPPQGADERVLLSKFTISSCALMLWDKAVTLQYKTTWKHSATALSFSCWNSAAANNTGTGTTWLLFQLLWAYTNQMPNQPMDKIAQDVSSGIEAIVNKIQNVQRYFLQPELLVRGERKGEKKIQTTWKEPTGIYCSGLSW